MKAAPTQGVDTFEEMYDRDIETLIGGGIPANTDLIPLRGILAELRSLAHSTVSESFIEFHVAEAAEFASARHVNAASSLVGGHGRRLVNGARRRTATAAATLAMFASATGVALASDDAVPGDWDYGIDRALEVAGIGAGGEEERLHELQVLDGLAVVAARSNDRSVPSDLLPYLKEADSVEGSSVSEIANNGAAKPEDPGSVGKANQPDDPGGSGGAGQPEDPGGSGGAAMPEDPGSVGRANQAEDPGSSGSASQPENPGGADDPKKGQSP